MVASTLLENVNINIDEKGSTTFLGCGDRSWERNR